MTFLLRHPCRGNSSVFPCTIRRCQSQNNQRVYFLVNRIEHQDTSQKGPSYGGHEGPMSLSHRSDFRPPQYRQEDYRSMRDDSEPRGTRQSQTMPRPVQQQPVSHTEQSRPMQKYSRPSSHSADPNMQRQTAKQDQFRSPPVSQKPGQRPVFNYVSRFCISFFCYFFLRWREDEFC